MRKRIILLFSAILYGFAFSIPVNAAVNSTGSVNEKAEIINQFNKQSKGQLKYYEKEGQVFVSGTLSDKRNSSKEDAVNYLEENKAFFGITSAVNSFETAKVEKDKKGDTFVTFNQKINGIKVRDKQIKIHYDNTGTIISINGAYQTDQQITVLDSSTITEENAVSIAKSQFKYNKLKQEPIAEKIIISKDGKLYETFKVNIYYIDPMIGNWDVFIDMHSGEVLEVSDNIRYDGAVTGSGTSVTGETKSLNLYQSESNYYMKDVTKASPELINTYTMNNRTSSGTLVSNTTTTFDTEDFKAGVSAHYNAGVVFDFYKNLFNRNGLDNAGMALNSFVHYGRKYNNAFWDGYEMVYGDGDGVNFTYLSGDTDVVGHEMTHGVIDKTAGLVYSDQSGALNESMADVFGVLIETYDKYNVKNGGTWSFDSSDWVVGDEIYTPGTPDDALRSLWQPEKYGQPSNMSSYVNTTSDNGGVHTNSGIPNKAAASIANLIGMAKTALIYYDAMTKYMTPSTDFVQAYNCVHQAAVDYYGAGSAEAAAVDHAFISVGIISEPTVAVTEVTLNKSTLSLRVGKTSLLTATVNPTNASNKAVAWTSSNTNVATVDSTGKVTAKGVGTAVITVTTQDGGFTAKCSVTVTKR